MKQNGEKAIYYINRALCYIKLKQWDRVYADVRHALELEPNYIKGHAYLGQYYIEQQRYDDAINSLQHASDLCKAQSQNFGDEIHRLLRLAQKRRFAIVEQKRIENEISLQTYLRSLIENDQEQRMQVRLEEYLQVNPNRSDQSTDSLSMVKEYLTRRIDTQHVPRTTTTIVIDQTLEQDFEDIKQSTDQALNEMNDLFNEVDNRRKRREIPEYLTCKLCYDLMRDPVITPCKSNIEDRSSIFFPSFVFSRNHLLSIMY